MGHYGSERRLDMLRKRETKWSMRLVIGLVTVALVMGLGSAISFAKEKTPLAVAVPQDLKNLYWVNLLEGFKHACEALEIPYRIIDGQGKETVQMNGIEDAIVQGAKFVWFCPVGGVMARAVIEKCDEAQVYTTMWSGMAPEVLSPSKFEYYTCWISNYGEPQGYMLGEELFKVLGGKGQIVAIHGIPG
jgi:ABC-type sugar transport system substrate-binding protein